jgi:uncharacterized phage-associated protein
MSRLEQLEAKINRLSGEIVERERELRVAQEAAKELVRLRSELRTLAAEYLTITTDDEQGWHEVVKLIEKEVMR